MLTSALVKSARGGVEGGVKGSGGPERLNLGCPGSMMRPSTVTLMASMVRMRPSPSGECRWEGVDVRLAVLAYRYLDMGRCFVSPRRRLWNVRCVGGHVVATARTVRKREGPQEGGVVNMAAWCI